ncbi:MAG TPA: DUF3352 domain-containing protein [Actinomycetota bacterium]|nr:DUF3352 domain-containing protein [Actinomycetota bacterium]
MRPVHALAALVAASLVAAAGCGGDGAGDLASGAEVAPASAAFFLSFDSDFDSDQWQAAEDLAAKFPGGRDALRSLPNKLEGNEDVDFENDVKPALGPEVDVVLLDFEDEEAAVALTQPADEAKWRELVGKGDEPSVTEEIDGGWWAAAESQEALDRFKDARSDDSLAESDAFEQAMGELGDEALATAFVNGAALTAQLRQDAETTPDERQALECVLGGGDVPSLAFGLAAEDDGFRLSGAFLTEGREAPESGPSDLAEELPAGALVFGSMHDLGRQVRDALRCVTDANDEARTQLMQAQLALGLSIEEDILPLFDGETAYAVYRQSESESQQGATPFGLTTITVVTDVEDEERAREVVDQIAVRASTFVDGVRVTDVDVGGIAAKRVTLPNEGGGTVLYAVFDGKLVLTSAEEGLLGFTEDGPRLSEDEAYEAARDAAGAPDEAAGVLYANVGEFADLFLEAFMGLPGGPPSDTREALDPVRSLFLWGEADDDVTTIEGFVHVE